MHRIGSSEMPIRFLTIRERLLNTLKGAPKFIVDKSITKIKNFTSHTRKFYLLNYYFLIKQRFSGFELGSLDVYF